MSISESTAQAVLDLLGLTRTDLHEALAQPFSDQAQRPSRTDGQQVTQEPPDQDLEIKVGPVTTTFATFELAPTSENIPFEPNPESPQNPVVCTGILNGVAASCTVLTMGDLATL